MTAGAAARVLLRKAGKMSKIRWLLAALGMAVIGLVPVLTSSSSANADPGTILGTEWAVQLGIVYAYLPFMVLPLYAALEKLDTSLLEAAADLGARPFAAFLARFRAHLAAVERVMGGLLVLTGIAFLTGFISQASYWLLEAFPVLGQIG